jgi:hypothetical protein
MDRLKVGRFSVSTLLLRHVSRSPHSPRQGSCLSVNSVKARKEESANLPSEESPY